MTSCLEDAIPILHKWKAEGSKVYAFFVGDSLAINSIMSLSREAPLPEGSVFELRDESTQFLAKTTGLAGVEFGDPREAPADVRPLAAERYECFLAFSWLNGDTLFLFELKP